MSLSSREDDTPKLLIQSFASSAETADQETSMPSMEKTVPPEPDDAVVREQILRRFESWLDDVLSQEEPPQGIVSEILSQLQSDSKPLQTDTENGKGDLYSLWSVLTAQTQETRLQGRAFKQLHDKLAPMEDLGNSMTSMLAAHEESLATARSIAEDARSLHSEQEKKNIQTAKYQGREEILNLLLDVRDRLVRGLDSAHKHWHRSSRKVKRNWFRWILRKFRPDGVRMLEATEALVKGYELSLVRIEEALEQFEVYEIVCKGQPFDPQCMTAVDIEETTQIPEGTVLDVYRIGYKWEDRIFRTAEVKVARQPKNPQ